MGTAAIKVLAQCGYAVRVERGPRGGFTLGYEIEREDGSLTFVELVFDQAQRLDARRTLE